MLLVEAVLPDRATDDPAVRMDLHMLDLLRGRERTAREYAALLTTAGFVLIRVVSTGSRSGVQILETTPASG
ncbi:methyltransferase [Pseudonocardia sp. H11422]|uniref:methyltransferase n=1 Tax=Pseudonocardia sp. H11422 TaxID=2835866 RepID=UPI001BDD249D|nr:methyltransferase [Pseudonocardia sp. H11422]